MIDGTVKSLLEIREEKKEWPGQGTQEKIENDKDKVKYISKNINHCAWLHSY